MTLSLSPLPVILPLGSLSETYVFRSELLTEGESSGEVKGWTGMQKKAYRKCLNGLTAQAKARGAAGVIDVKFLRQERDWDVKMTELGATGTAITVHSEGKTKKDPFVCALTLAELRRLRQAGYFPAGHVVGVAAYRQKSHLRVEYQAGSKYSPNTERSDFTRGIYAARKLAMERLHEQADALGASGIIGVSVTMTKRGLDEKHPDRLVIGLIAQGTAIYDVTATPAAPFIYGVSLGISTHQGDSKS